MDIVERLIAFRDYTGLTNSQFADRAGIPRPTLSQFLNGRNKRLSDDFTAKLHSAYPMLNVMWLLFGEGAMVTDANIQFSESKNELSEGVFADQSAENKTVASQSTRIDTLHDSEPIQRVGAVSGQFGGVMSANPLPGANISPDPAKKIQSIMVFYSDNSYEIFTPSGGE